MAEAAANTLLLFGATGDLAQRMLLPSLFGLDADGLLPEGLRIFGTAHTELDEAGFRACAASAIERHFDQAWRGAEKVERFLGRLHYVRLDASRPEEYARLALFMAENPYLNGEYVRLDGAIRMAPR